MSVLITLKIKGDVDVFTAAMADRGAEFEKVAARGRDAGALHHRFGLGDGYVLVIDEWESLEQFERFFGDPEMQAFVGSVGADPSTPPEMTVAEAIESPDSF